MGSQHGKQKSSLGKVKLSDINQNMKQANRKLSQQTEITKQLSDTKNQHTTVGKLSVPSSRKVSDNITDVSERLGAADSKRKATGDSSSSISFSNSSSSSSSSQYSKTLKEVYNNQEQIEEDFKLVMQEQKSQKNKQILTKSKKPNYTETMLQRWKGYMAEIPNQDRIDLVHSFMNERIQNCPEYSQEVYVNMCISEDSQFGQFLYNYTSLENSGSRHFAQRMRLREEFAERILHLCSQKNYKPETMHLALNIFDRVLVSQRIGKIIEISRESMPLLIITAVLLAAKIEQPLTPSIRMTVKLFPEDELEMLTKPRILQMERYFIEILDFDFQILSPLTFLERILRLTQTDLNDQLSMLAKEILFVARTKNQYIGQKPSHIAACAYILAQSVCTNHTSPSIKFWDQELITLTQLKKDEIWPLIDLMQGICKFENQNPEDKTHVEAKIK